MAKLCPSNPVIVIAFKDFAENKGAFITGNRNIPQRREKLADNKLLQFIARHPFFKRPPNFPNAVRSESESAAEMESYQVSKAVNILRNESPD